MVSLRDGLMDYPMANHLVHLKEIHLEQNLVKQMASRLVHLKGIHLDQNLVHYLVHCLELYSVMHWDCRWVNLMEMLMVIPMDLRSDEWRDYRLVLNLENYLD